MNNPFPPHIPPNAPNVPPQVTYQNPYQQPVQGYPVYPQQTPPPYGGSQPCPPPVGYPQYSGAQPAPPYPPQGAMPYPPYPMQPVPPMYMVSPLQLAKNSQRTAVRQAASRAAGLLLLLLLITNVIALVFMAPSYLVDWMRGTNAAASKLGSDYGVFLTQFLPIILGEVAILLIARPFLKVNVFDRALFKRHDSTPKMTLLGAGACLGGGAVGFLVTTLFATIFAALGKNLVSTGFDVPNAPLPAALTLLYICIAGPVLEELVFRGAILKSLAKHGEKFAVVLSALLFTVFHMNFEQIVTPLIIGLILGFITVRSKSIVPAIICHVFNNSFVMLLSYIVPAKHNLAYMSVYYTIAFIILVVFLWVFFEQMTKLNREGESPLLTTPAKVRAGIANVPAVVLLVLFALMVITSVILQSPSIAL